jgi:hypothetical protein
MGQIPSIATTCADGKDAPKADLVAGAARFQVPMSARWRNRGPAILRACIVAVGEIDLIGQDDKAGVPAGELGANDNEGLLTHSHAGAWDAVGRRS